MSALVLGFDTSASHCAAALLRGDTVVAEAFEEMGKGQADRLFPLLEQVLADGGAHWRDLSAIGVGTGPGNFTGIRISVSAARGLGVSLGVPVVGVSRLEAQALDLPRPVLSLVDGRRGMAYAQLFTETGATTPELIDPAALPSHLIHPDMVCVGAGAEGLAVKAGAAWATPKHPLAVATAMLAATRYAGWSERPAPLYIRTADAAPSRDAPPVILS